MPAQGLLQCWLQPGWGQQWGATAACCGRVGYRLPVQPQPGLLTSPPPQVCESTSPSAHFCSAFHAISAFEVLGSWLTPRGAARWTDLVKVRHLRISSQFHCWIHTI